MADEYVSIFTGEEIDRRLGKVPTIEAAVAQKQDIIPDLATIRSGAAAGATAYQKPNTGIPKTDMTNGVQTSLGKADTAYQKPSGGVPKTDLASAVQTSLDKADAAAPQSTTYTKTEVDNALATKADKDMDAVEGNLAEFDANGNPVDSGVPATKIGEIEEGLSVLRNSAGIAEGIADTISAGTPQEFVFRQSGGDGVNYIKRFKGRTLAWNQLCAIPSTDVSKTESSVVVTDYRNGSYNFNGTPSANVSIALPLVSIVSGHKYYIASNSNGKLQIDCSGYGNWDSTPSTKTSKIITCTNTNTSIPYIVAISADGAVNATSYPEFVDLTLMFGAGNEPSTVEEFEAMFPGYHDYSAGKLISNDASALETVGFNQWDEEWELGAYDDSTGVPIVSSKNLRSKENNPISVFPNTAYCFTGSLFRVLFYDSEMNFISKVNVAHGNTVTTPANCCHIRFYMATAYGTTYNNDICINLSDSSFNGQYEPYRKSTLHLGLNNIRVKSHNIWDEEWENGFIGNAGSLQDRERAIRSKNFNECFGGAVYHVKSNRENAFAGLRWYDINKNYLGMVESGSLNNDYQAPTNAAFFKVSVFNYTPSETTATYLNDICINVSSSFNGQYEPHGILTINGVKSAGSVYDEIVGNKYVKRVGSVDLGDDLTWTLGSNSVGATRYYCNSIADIKPISGGGVIPNIICQKYLPISQNTSYSSDISGVAIYNSVLYITDNSFSGQTAAQFKAAMSGVMLNYELATPIEYELAEPIPNAILVDELGTEQAIFPTHEDGSPSAPFCCDSNYSISVKNLVAKLNALNG